MKPVSPAEKVTLALLGVGGRGSQLIRDFAKRGDVDIAYLCDPDARRGPALAAELSRTLSAPPKVVADFRQVLQDKSVDAVVVATPDHWHAPLTVFACQAGKHVYVEKPASLTPWEGRKMVEAARKYNRVVQTGTQGRSAPYVHAARDYIAAGKLGRISYVKVFNMKSGGPLKLPADSDAPKELNWDMWLGQAPKRNYNPGRCHGGWYYFWDYCGGDTGNDASHQLDIARFLIGKDYPTKVSGIGGRLAFPHSDGDVHDTQSVTFDFGDLLMTYELTQWAPYMDKIAQDIRDSDMFPSWPTCATRIEVYGDKAMMYLGRHGGGWQVFGKAKTQSRPAELIDQMPGRVPDIPHKEDFLNAIRNNRKPNADIEEGHRSAILSHLANAACRVGGRTLEFDAKTETVTNCPEVNTILRRPVRKPWAVPERV
jgi:predicted dehydrogenase